MNFDSKLKYIAVQTSNGVQTKQQQHTKSRLFWILIKEMSSSHKYVYGK